jgi:methionyl-tRNA formyltransferase
LLGGYEYDTGLILGQKKIELIYPVTVRDAILATAPLYQHLMFEILDKYRSMGILRGQAQDERLATYSLWRDESDYRIDWRQSSQKIKRLIDAVGLPYAGASTTWRTKILRILEAEVVPDVVVEARGSHIGKVIFNQLEGFVVVCGTGLLKIKKAVDDDTGEAINLPFRSRFE